MRFEPRRSQTTGRIIIKRVLKTIIRPDETKNTTKFMLVDGVGDEAKAAGIHVGDVVLPGQFENFILDGGVFFRPIVEEKDIRMVIRNAVLDEFMMQTDSGSEFVPFDDAKAAKNLCEDAPSKSVGAAA
jgi:hypothetical protein